MGKKWVLGLCAALLMISSLQGKIYDCFLFFNEIELLEIRLRELNDHVDYFVLVESCETFKGNEKPFYFEEVKERFAPFLDKIIHVKVEDHFETSRPFNREYFQRNQIMRGLQGCKNNDIIFLSDLDEIYRSSMVTDILAPFKSPAKPLAVVCQFQKYLFYLNRPKRHKKGIWYGTIVTTYANMKKSSPQAFRNEALKFTAGHGNKKIQCIYNAGWHFGWLGGVDAYIEKLKAYSHTPQEVKMFIKEEVGEEVEVKNFKPKEIKALLQTGPFLPVDESFPKWVQQNQEYYYKIGFLHPVETPQESITENP